MRNEFHIQLPLAAGEGYFTVCIAQTPEAAGALVVALLSCDLREKTDVRILVVPVPVS